MARRLKTERKYTSKLHEMNKRARKREGGMKSKKGGKRGWPKGKKHTAAHNKAISEAIKESWASGKLSKYRKKGGKGKGKRHHSSEGKKSKRKGRGKDKGKRAKRTVYLTHDKKTGKSYF